MANPTPTTARELTRHLAELLRRERHAMADFLLALADFDRRKRWVELGHASLFSFLRRELGLSAGAAQYRKTAAELLQRVPAVEPALREGKLCLSSIAELAKVVTDENLSTVLPRFFGLSSREAAIVAAEIRPAEHAPVRDVITAVGALPTAIGALPPERLLSTAGATQLSISNGQTTSIERSASTVHPVRAPEPAVPGIEGLRAVDEAGPAPAPARPEPRSSVGPLDADRARLHVTVSRRFLAKLEKARSELSHVRPGASAEQILEAALDALLEKRARRKGTVAKPRAAPPRTGMSTGSLGFAANRDTVTANVKREVWARSGHRCEWPLDAGGVCGSQFQLEIDHVTPRAMGGSSRSENLRILCRPHQLVAARRELGPWVEQYARKRRRLARTSAPAELAPATPSPAVPSPAAGSAAPSRS